MARLTDKELRSRLAHEYYAPNAYQLPDEQVVNMITEILERRAQDPQPNSIECAKARQRDTEAAKGTK